MCWRWEVSFAFSSAEALIAAYLAFGRNHDVQERRYAWFLASIAVMEGLQGVLWLFALNSQHDSAHTVNVIFSLGIWAAAWILIPWAVCDFAKPLSSMTAKMGHDVYVDPESAGPSVPRGSALPCPTDWEQDDPRRRRSDWRRLHVFKGYFLAQAGFVLGLMLKYNILATKIGRFGHQIWPCSAALHAFGERELERRAALPRPTTALGDARASEAASVWNFCTAGCLLYVVMLAWAIQPMKRKSFLGVPGGGDGLAGSGYQRNRASTSCGVRRNGTVEMLVFLAAGFATFASSWVAFGKSLEACSVWCWSAGFYSLWFLARPRLLGDYVRQTGAGKSTLVARLIRETTAASMRKAVLIRHRHAKGAMLETYRSPTRAKDTPDTDSEKTTTRSEYSHEDYYSVAHFSEVFDFGSGCMLSDGELFRVQGWLSFLPSTSISSADKKRELLPNLLAPTILVDAVGPHPVSFRVSAYLPDLAEGTRPESRHGWGLHGGAKESLGECNYVCGHSKLFVCGRRGAVFEGAQKQLRRRMKAAAKANGEGSPPPYREDYDEELREVFQSGPRDWLFYDLRLLLKELVVDIRKLVVEEAVPATVDELAEAYGGNAVMDGDSFSTDITTTRKRAEEFATCLLQNMRKKITVRSSSFAVAGSMSAATLHAVELQGTGVTLEYDETVDTVRLAPSWMQKTLHRAIMVALAASRTVEGALSVPSGYESLMYDIRERVVVSERDVTRPTAEKVCSSTEGPFCLRNNQNFIGDTVLSRRLFGPDALGEALKTLNDYLATYSDELFRRYRQQQQAKQDAQTKVRKAVVNPFTKLEEERKAAKAMKETMDRIKKHGREDTNSPKEEAATSKADATSGTGSSSGKAEGSPAAAEGKAGKSDGDVPTLKKGSASDDHSTSTAKSDKQNALLKALFGDNVEGGPPQGANFAAFHIDAGEVNLEELLGAQQGAAGANGEAGAAAVGGNLANLLGQALQGGGGGGGDPNNGPQVQAFRIDDPEQIMKLMAGGDHDGEDLEKIMHDALKKQAKKKDGLSEDEVAEEDENEMEEKEEASSSTSAKPIPAPDGRGKTPDRETGGTKAAEKNAANQDESAAAEANSSGSAEDSTKPKPGAGAATEDPEELLRRLLEGLGGAKDSPDKGAASSKDSPGSEEEVASPGSDDGDSTPTSDLDSDDEENENADTTKSKRFATSTKRQNRISAKERLRKRYRESYLRRVDRERNRWTFENAESYLQYFEEVFEATPSANRRRNIQLQQMETEVNFHKARPAKERAKSEKHPFFHAGAFTQFTARYFPNAMDNFLAPLDMFSRQHVHREADLYVRPTEEHAEDPGSPGTGVVRPEGYLDAWQEKHQPEDAQKGGSGMPQPVNVIFERAGLRQFSAEREDMKVVVRQRENVFATEVQY
eukprot:g1689.t1